MTSETRDWRTLAACSDSPNHLWFANSGTSATAIAARAICRQCPVQVDCLAFAMADRAAFSYGIWAGTSPEDRSRLRRAQDAAPRPRLVVTSP